MWQTPTSGAEDDGAVQFDPSNPTGWFTGGSSIPIANVTQIASSGDACRSISGRVKTGSTLTTGSPGNGYGLPIIGRWGMDGTGSYNVGWAIDIDLDNAQIRWRFADGAGTEQKVNGSVLTANTWYHVACTYDGTTYRLYLNGTLVTSYSPEPLALANQALPSSESASASTTPA